MKTGTHGRKRRETEPVDSVQAGNAEWWETTPMEYDWGRGHSTAKSMPEWFQDQDDRSTSSHAHFATTAVPFDRLIPYERIKGVSVLEIGIGSGLHSELMARAGATVTGIDLTTAAVTRTKARFELKGLNGTFDSWDAEKPREAFLGRFNFVWSWGVIHHSSRTARIVRNVADWTTDGGEFAGMVYNRDALPAIIALARDGLIRGRYLSRTSDEILWSSTDGYSARFYTPDQWRDLLLGFFENAEVAVTGQLSDVLPLPRRLRGWAAKRMSPDRRDRALARFGSFITFKASNPIRSSSR
jgi:2-polyprenyl-3-methyl-5-hydroxy-6-metoxy-1,4-benzoquinol methylase